MTPVPPETPPAPIAEKKQAPVEVEKSETLAPVYFETDRAVLRTEARHALSLHAKSILKHPEWGVVRTDGHCDERGSADYNLALGKDRAAVVERYLVNMGVPASRLTTRTFGARKPAVRGHDEESWQHNRRSELHSEDMLASK